ncbi:hypothetical protein SVIO_001700 [Streptomyces violaceusniger]|uniref:Uncharacterized protein n=1 Tax=Streptomyces violaceusniger TaxID=68280 RepID=A0A4D4KSV8_STRVO|nr:hypothetical protein SVIO_001700 [Streptomyces violaceusniger]
MVRRHPELVEVADEEILTKTIARYGCGSLPDCAAMERAGRDPRDGPQYGRERPARGASRRRPLARPMLLTASPLSSGRSWPRGGGPGWPG